jgi:DNA-binding NtrC family response regulator
MPQETILIVDDEKLIRWSLAERLRSAGYRTVEAEDGASAFEALDEHTIDLVLLDYKLPDMTGHDILARVRAEHPAISVTIMTAHSTVDRAVEAMKLGAFDYLNKPFDYDEMVAGVGRALEATRLRRELRRLREEQQERYGVGNLVGRSPAMRDVFVMIRKVAASTATTVLVQGESGTGKDLVAKAIHFSSYRAGAPFMNITCSALPETLLESELFGHERGAFTDAHQQKKGLFELAHGGTVFLDEIGDMGLTLQAKLLRFLEDKTFKRVGGARDISVDVRIVAATNRDLEAAVRERAFREDLYYRLKVIPIYLPPLRERCEDIFILVEHFVDTFNRDFKKTTEGFTDEAMEHLMAYGWPGNVRELRNVVERAMILENKDLLGLEDLPPELGGPAPAAPSAATESAVPLPAEGVVLEEVERDLVAQALERTGGNQTRAARLLGISRDALRYKIKKFGLR